MTNTYAKAYTEVLEIISHFSEDEYNKIPKEKISYYENNCDKEYEFKINPEIDLSEQNISDKANAILVMLFRDYYADEKQKEVLKNLLMQNQNKKEQEKIEKYSNVDIFNKKKEISNETQQSNETITENALIVIKEETFFKKILNFFRSIFKRG